MKVNPVLKFAAGRVSRVAVAVAVAVPILTTPLTEHLFFVMVCSAA